MIKAVLLDLFGTVVAYGDVREGTRLAWEGIYTVLRELGAQVAFTDFVVEWERQFQVPLTPREDVASTPFLGKMVRLFHSYGLPADLPAAERAVWACLNGWDEHLYLPDDTLDTLATLRRRYGVALVSNFDHPPYVRQMLDRFGLSRLFDDIRISGELRIDKPDPRIFQAALDALDCPPPQAVFVGDNLQADIEGSRGVGCRPVLIDMRARYIEYTDPRIERLGELPDLIAQLEG